MSGEVRAMIVDPVWKGWITLRNHRGEALCEPVEDESGTGGVGASLTNGDHNAAVAPLIESMTLMQLKNIQDECMADDIAVEPDEMIYWTEDEARRYFESNAEERPPRRNLGQTNSNGTNDAPIDVTEGSASGETPAAATDAAAAEPQSAPTAGADVPMSKKQKAARDAGEWAKGVMVLLRGLSAETSLNGRSGVIAAWDAARGRYDVRLANRVVRALPENLGYHPLQRQRDANDRDRGDEVVFLTEDAKAARAGTYAVKLDPQFWYDEALKRVFDAANEFAVLELPVESTEDFTRIRKAYRKVSLHVHPDKNKHPQADAAFRKVYGAFETLSDPVQQRRLLFELGLNCATTEKEKQMYEKAGAEDEDDLMFQWWWEATVPDVEKAAEEAEGAEMDMYAASWVSDGLGDDVKDVRWIGIKKAQKLHEKDRAIFIDCREHADQSGGVLPGAWHVPMNAVQRYGIVSVLGPELIHTLLSTKRNALIVVYSNVATPFSRCRAFCRWLLRAGHKSLPAQRFRRLRGGIFGWQHRGGKVAMAISQRGATQADLEERLKHAEPAKDLETIDVN